MWGQKFQGGFILGMNAAQIDGDLLYGYNKPGLQLGAAIDYPYRPKVTLRLELLYCQRGSQDGFAFGGDARDRLRTSLDYASIPIIAEYKLLFNENSGMYKIRIYPGLAYSYLIDGTSPSGSLKDDKSIRNSDFSYLAGISYALTSKLWLGFRYTRSLLGLQKIEDRNEDALISYFLSFRVELKI
jgi:opacity protein-like surface antigen